MTELVISSGSVYSARFDPYSDNGHVGAKISLEFQPAGFKIKTLFADYTPDTDAELHLVQIVREVLQPGHGGGAVVQGNIGYAERCVPVNQPHAGWALDVDLITKKPIQDSYRAIAAARKDALANPPHHLANDYQAQRAADAAIVTGPTPQVGVLSSLDYRYSQQRLTETVPLFHVQKEQTTGNAMLLNNWKNATPATAGASPTTRATLRDNPNVPIDSAVLGMDFQSAILLQYRSTTGVVKNKYLAVVSWGWRREAGKSVVKLTDIAKVAELGLSPEFQAARAHWNGLTVNDPSTAAPHAVIQMPDHDA